MPNRLRFIPAPAPPPPSSLLQEISIAMPNRSWVYMNGTTQNGVVCTRPINFDVWTDPTKAFAAWGNRMVWNPVVNSIECNGYNDGNHDGTGYVRHQWYLLNTNACDGLWMQNPYGNHNFERLTCNPFDGQIHVRAYSYTGAVRRFTSGVYPPYTQLPNAPHDANIFAPTEWWRGSITGAAGQGLMTMVNVYPGYVDFYEPISNTWLAGTAVPGSMGQSYNLISAYSLTKNMLLFSGSATESTRLWKVLSNRSCVQMTDAPRSLALGDINFIADPITGNFLVHFNNRDFYELNPDGNGGMGTWTLLPPVPAGGALGTVSVNFNGVSNGCLVCCVQDLGVTVWVSENSNSIHMHVYKHGT